MTTPIFVTELERVLGAKLHPAPKHGNNPVRNVMACRKDPERGIGWLAQYALHEDGALAGLNLADLGLTDDQWLMLSKQLDFSRLEALNLRYNGLTTFPFGGKAMPNLRYLDLSDNKLLDFALPEGMEGLEHLFLYGNEFPDPVLFARAKQGRNALLEHLRGLAKGDMEELYEARMLIIGEPRAGKTSLRKKLQDVTNALPTLSTKGIDVDIDVESNSFQHKASTGKAVTFHYQVWDFGGQRQYHPTHQLFFVKSTLYILVTNTDYDHKNEGDVEFWLETVNKLGEGSPVLRFQNAQSDRPDSTDWKDINRRFGQMIKDVFTLNLKRVNPNDKTYYNPKDGKEFERLKNAIEAQLKGLEHVGSKVTPTWRKIREALAKEAKKGPHITLEHYQRICNECGYTDSTYQLELSKTFHTLGIFLHYQHNVVLRNTVILQNEWAIDAVFAILDSKPLRDNKGSFEQKDLPAIWGENRYNGKRDDLLQLLQEFELCYPLPNNKGYVAPQCLDKISPPQYKWVEKDNVRVDVTYDFLPRAVITRLIVKMHEHIAHKKLWAWQSGAVLEGDALKCKDTQAFVQEKYKERKIAISLRGPYSEDLFREIQSRLRDIHQGFPNLVVDYLIYCNCEDCKLAEQPTAFKYFEKLLYYRRELGREDIECGTKGKQVKIADILNGISSPSQAKEDQIRTTSNSSNFTLHQTLVMTKGTSEPSEQSNNSIFGVLIAFVVIFPSIALSVKFLDPVGAALTIVGTILLLMLALVYAGTQNKTLSEDAFVKISEGILRNIPGLGSLVSLIKGK